jgi:hypothetical protein
MPLRSVKLYWDEKTVGSGKILEFLFGERKDTLDTAKLLVERMKTSPNLAMSRREVRVFAKDLDAGKLGVKYSYHNFYVKLLRKLLAMGFVEKDVLIWDDRRKKTESVYQLRLQSIPERGPQAGFIKQCWQLAKGWNELIR